MLGGIAFSLVLFAAMLLPIGLTLITDTAVGDISAATGVTPRITTNILDTQTAAGSIGSSSGRIEVDLIEFIDSGALDGLSGWVGTGNWEPDYFFKSRNVGLLIDGGQIPLQLDAFFAGNWNSPYAAPFDRTREYSPPRISRAPQGRAALLFHEG